MRIGIAVLFAIAGSGVAAKAEQPRVQGFADSTLATAWNDGDVISDVGLGLAAVGAPHLVAPRTEDAVRGRSADDETLDLAAQMAAEECNPTADQRGPADYKRALAGELIKRALRTAIARCRGEEA